MTQAISFEIVYLHTVVGDGAKNEFGSCCQQLYDLSNHSCFFSVRMGAMMLCAVGKCASRLSTRL
jgi:hypothetical protein